MVLRMAMHGPCYRTQKGTDRKWLLAICTVSSNVASAEIAIFSEVHSFKEKA